ncbi:MAG: hypothetical protein QXL94_01785 [Candidatus Parvarchaeum sp.]
MTSSHWRSILYAVVTFIVGGSNQLFGTHFSVPDVYGTFALCIILITLEINYIRTKNFPEAKTTLDAYMEKIFAMFEKLINQARTNPVVVNTTSGQVPNIVQATQETVKNIENTTQAADAPNNTVNAK